MSAKAKINAANFMGAILIAGLVLALTGSVGMFAIALGGLLVAGVLSGDIRR